MLPLSILKKESIAAEIYEDGAHLEVPDLVNEYWLSSKIDDQIIGCYRVHPMGAVTWQIHSRILPQYRGRIAIDSGKTVLQWIFENIPSANIVMCFVPRCHRNVGLYCRQVGFEYMGTLKKSYLKNQTLYDQEIFGISREEVIGGELCQPLQSLPSRE